jgi:hypothetical protein
VKLTNYFRLAAVVPACVLALSPLGVLAAESTKLKEERGTIKSLDAEAHTLVVTDRKDNSEKKFAWNDQTKFTERGKTVTATEIKPGDRIRLTYKANGDTPNIERAHLAPAKAEKSASEKS